MDSKISAWDTTEPLNTGTGPLPPVNPWDVVPSESVESTGWANFDNFENTLSIENKESENKKSTNDECKEKTSEATAINLTKRVSSENIDVAETISNENVENSNEKNANSVGNEADLSAIKNSNKSEENEIISTNENVNSKELPASRYFI